MIKEYLTPAELCEKYNLPLNDEEKFFPKRYEFKHYLEEMIYLQMLSQSTEYRQIVTSVRKIAKDLHKRYGKDPHFSISATQAHRHLQNLIENDLVMILEKKGKEGTLYLVK